MRCRRDHVEAALIFAAAARAFGEVEHETRARPLHLIGRSRERVLKRSTMGRSARTRSSATV
jgi:hypothetical protein